MPKDIVTGCIKIVNKNFLDVYNRLYDVNYVKKQAKNPKNFVTQFTNVSDYSPHCIKPTQNCIKYVIKRKNGIAQTRIK